MKKATMKHRLIAAVFALGCVCGVSGFSVSAAVTPDDVANKARELGFPEAQVQQGYNLWSSEEFTQEHLDLAWEALIEFENGSTELFELILGSVGGDVSDLPSTPPAESVESTKPTESTESTQGATEASGSPTEATETAQPPEETQAPSKEFSKMTLEEKQAYVAGMSEEERKNFLQNLSPEERKSLIKQMSIGDKADLVEKYLNVAEQMGVHLTVDKITDDNISLTIRDEQGTIIDKSEMGVTIDETGISHTGLLVSAAAGVIAALSGLAALGRKLGKDESES